MASLSISAFALDVGRTSRDLALVHQAGADSLHVDIMDGHFVTLMGLSTHWLASMRQEISLPVDLHFMTLQPDRFIAQYASLGVASMVFHVESVQEGGIGDILKMIASYSVRRGLAISPNSDLRAIAPFLHDIDDLLVMSSFPGTPGSIFLESSYERIQNARSMVNGAGSTARIAVDGGLDLEKARACLENGANTVIIGKAFFNNADPKALVEKIHDLSPGRRLA